jgi:hypothetical protein
MYLSFGTNIESMEHARYLYWWNFGSDNSEAPKPDRRFRNLTEASSARPGRIHTWRLQPGLKQVLTVGAARSVFQAIESTMY